MTEPRIPSTPPSAGPPAFEPFAAAAPVVAFLGAAALATVQALTAPVTTGSRRNAWGSVCRDRSAAHARAEALHALAEMYDEQAHATVTPLPSRTAARTAFNAGRLSG